MSGATSGYRWGRHEVDCLLDDIEASGTQNYYLAPVVVKRMDDGRWELIDGQQRLTTLFLILRYVQEHLPSAKLRYHLEYQTRLGSMAYLQEPDEKASSDNIDFFHAFHAATRIRAWFQSKPDPAMAAINFYKALSETVNVRRPKSHRRADFLCRDGACLCSVRDGQLGH